MLNGSSGDIYLDRALDNRVVRDIAGEHRACRGGTAGKCIAPVFNTGHIAVNSSRAGCRIAHRQRICISLRLIRGRPAVQRSPAAVRVVLNGNGCHIVNILFSCGIAIQIIAEPLVQNAVIAFLTDQQRGLVGVIVRGDMCALMQEQLDGLPGIFERVVHHLELLGADVIIVQTVNDKCRAVEVIFLWTFKRLKCYYK